jgi:cytochrome c oxidase accessory protein FixG
MFDQDTLIISYDEKRGEPRGSRRRGSDPAEQGLGDCVDCTLCVQVCPTGIDIRNGLQYQCVSCAGCVDVCDQVMDRMGYDRGLISYTTERALAGGKTRLFRPRLFIYAALLLAIITAIGASVWLRVPVELDVIRDRMALYRETSEGMIENVYTLRLINMDSHPHEFRIAMESELPLTTREPLASVPLAAFEIREAPLTLSVDPVEITTSTSDVYFSVQASDQPELTARAESRFIGPVN